MRVAVFGAAGFLGRRLCRHLRQAGWDVCGRDVSDQGPLEDGLEYRRCDVLVDELALPESTEAVFYLPQSPFYRQFPQKAAHLFGVNTLGAIRAAEAACRAGAKAFFYASTGNVYAPSLGPLTEDWPVRRDDPYALSKVAAEEALRLFAAQLPVISLRLFGLFGPGQTKMLPFTLWKKVQAGEAISLEPVEGENGEPEGLTVSLSYVADTAACLERLARLALEGNHLPPALNVAGPEPISIRRFAVALGRILHREPRFVRAEKTRSMNLIADLKQLQALLGPPHTPFDEAMARSYGDAAPRGCHYG
jgi:nucleoside-diphosphate-sugar epimerase